VEQTDASLKKEGFQAPNKLYACLFYHKIYKINQKNQTLADFLNNSLSFSLSKTTILSLHQ
jgi:hypothetical protein